MMGTLVPFYQRALAAASAALVTAGLSLVGFSSPAPAAPAPLAACAREQQDPAAAKRMAEICKAPVENLGERTPYSQVFLNPDGTSTLEQSVEPQRVLQSKKWVPVDTTLVATADGVSPRAAVLPMMFSDGGDTLVGRLGSGSKEVSLRWPSKLPKPDLKGDTAVYRDVLPDVDLRVTASATGFSELLVVHTPQAAVNPRLKSLKFGLGTKGVKIGTTAGGGLRAQDASGTEVFTAPAPVMWDSTESVESSASSTPSPSSPAPDSERSTRAVMPLKIADGVITVTPNRKMLASPGTRFPVYIDPMVSGSLSGNAWTSVWNKYPSKSFWKNATALTDGSLLGSAGAGRTEDCSGCSDHIIRSLFRMDTSKVKGKVSKAQFSIEQRWSWTCSPVSNAKVWKTGGISSSTTWNNQPTWYGSQTAQTTGNRKYGSVHGCKGPGTIEFNVTNMVASGASTLTLGLRAVDEGTKNQWKRFKPSTARLSVTFNQPPAALSNRKSDGQPCVVGASRPYVLWTTDVKLTGYQQDPDAPSSLTTYFYWWAKGATRSESNRVQQSNGNKATATGTVPNGRLTDGLTYTWQARTSDGAAETWSGTCEFTVDKTPPPNPGAITSTDYSTTSPSGGVGLPGTFKVTAPSTRKEDVTGYAWTLDSGEQLAAKPQPQNADGSATITLKPIKDGINTLRVWTKDRAGRFSPAPSTYTFTVRAGTGPAAEWTFDEPSGTTATDVSGHGNTGTFSGATTRVAGRGNVGGAVAFDGTSGYVSTPGAATYPHPDTGAATVVRTDATYTVAAWVKLNDLNDTGQPSAFSGNGSRAHSFRLGFAGQNKKWVFALANADTDTTATVAAWSDATATANKWTHLAGVYNAATKRLVLYVNGVAQAGQPTGTGAFHSTGPLLIGKHRWKGADDGKWRGQVDDVRIYSYAETAARIAELAVPQQPAITFPNGSEGSAGGTLAVKFDAGGDTNVTRFKYSVDGTGLGSTVNASAPGGTATVTLTMGTQTGERQVYVVADTGTRSGAMNREQFTILPSGSLSGSVLDSITWAGSVGATVTLQPGGYTATTDADGGYVFANLPRGTYTVSAGAGGRCGMAGSQPYLIDGQGLNLDLYLFRKTDALGHLCVERATTFATGTAVLPLTGDDAVTTVTLPFAFPFYGGNYRKAWVDTNGLLAFTDPGGSHPYTGTGDLIAAAEPNAVIAPFWDDLVVDSSASIRTAVIGSGGTQQVLIEWRNVHRKGNTTQRLSFSVALSIDGTVTTNYSGLDNAAEKGDNALVGLEAPTGDDGYSYSAGDPALSDNQAVVFTRPDAMALEVYNLTGKLTDEAGAGVSGATVTLDPSGLATTTAADGSYSFLGVVADSYTVASRWTSQCGGRAEVQVGLYADMTQDLRLGPAYGEMGYACVVGTGGYIAAGTKIALTGDYEHTDVNLPFPVQFYGRSATVATVWSNGGIAVGGGRTSPFSGLETDGSAGVWTQLVGTAPNRSFVIEWRNGLLGTGDRVSAEVVLHEDGRVAFHYGAMTTDAQKGGAAAIGLWATSWEVSQVYASQQPVLTPDSSITYTPAPPGTINGILTEAVTAEPIAGRTITLHPGGRTATTGADGSYRLPDVPPGEYLVMASYGDNRCAGQFATVKHFKAAGDAKVDLSLSPNADPFYDCTVTSQAFVPGDTVHDFHGDDGLWKLTAPFPIELYGETSTDAWVDANGLLTINADVGLYGSDYVQPIPSGTDLNDNWHRSHDPNAALYPFWADWVVDDAAAIATKVIGTAPNRQWVVEWRNVAVYGEQARASFEVVFDESGGFAFAYDGIDDTAAERGGDATVGIEDTSGTVAFQYLYQADLLHNGLGIRFTRKAPATNAVNGTVTCEGEPVDGATVSVAGQSTLTPADGVYSFAALPARTHSVLTTIPSGACAGSSTRSVVVGAYPQQVDFAELFTPDNTAYKVTETTTQYEALGADKQRWYGASNSGVYYFLPFPVKVYGQTYDRITVYNGGSIKFDDKFLYPLASDWEADPQNDVRAAVRGTAPNRQYVIEWHNVRHASDTDTRVTFQAILHEGGSFTFVYPSTDLTYLSRGGAALIGVQNMDVSHLFWSDRTPSLRPGLSLRFDPVTTD